MGSGGCEGTLLYLSDTRNPADTQVQIQIQMQIHTCVLYENCISIDKHGRVEHKIWQFTFIVLNSFVLYASMAYYVDEIVFVSTIFVWLSGRITFGWRGATSVQDIYYFISDVCCVGSGCVHSGCGAIFTNKPLFAVGPKPRA